jgi:endonuclease I
MSDLTILPKPIPQSPSTEIPKPIPQSPSTEIPKPIPQSPSTEIPKPIPQSPSTEIPEIPFRQPPTLRGLTPVERNHSYDFCKECEKNIKLDIIYKRKLFFEKVFITEEEGSETNRTINFNKFIHNFFRDVNEFFFNYDKKVVCEECDETDETDESNACESGKINPTACKPIMSVEHMVPRDVQSKPFIPMFEKPENETPENQAQALKKFNTEKNERTHHQQSLRNIFYTELHNISVGSTFFNNLRSNYPYSDLSTVGDLRSKEENVYTVETQPQRFRIKTKFGPVENATLSDIRRNVKKYEYNGQIEKDGPNKMYFIVNDENVDKQEFFDNPNPYAQEICFDVTADNIKAQKCLTEDVISQGKNVNLQNVISPPQNIPYTGSRSPQYNSPKFNSPRYNSPRYNSPRYNSPRYDNPRHNSPGPRYDNSQHRHSHGRRYPESFHDQRGGNKVKIARNKFEIDDANKGVSARAYFYILFIFGRELANSGRTIYETGGLTDIFSNNNLESMLDWNRRYPPQKQEKSLNDAKEKVQNTRNPFIDDYELINKIVFKKGSTMSDHKHYISDAIIPETELKKLEATEYILSDLYFLRKFYVPPDCTLKMGYYPIKEILTARPPKKTTPSSSSSSSSSSSDSSSNSSSDSSSSSSSNSSSNSSSDSSSSSSSSSSSDSSSNSSSSSSSSSDSGSNSSSSSGSDSSSGSSTGSSSSTISSSLQMGGMGIRTSYYNIYLTNKMNYKRLAQ